MDESRTKRVKNNIISGLINKIIVVGIPFITRTIIIWKLGASFLGLSSLFASILQVLNMAELGFSSAIVFSLYKPLAENDTECVCALMAFYRKVYKYVGLCILIVGGILTPFLPYLIKGDYPTSINLYILYLMYVFNTVISYWAYAYKAALVTADQRIDITNNINTVITLVQGGLQVFVLIIWENYYFFYGCVIIGSILNNILTAIVTSKKYPQYICKGEIDDEIKLYNETNKRACNFKGFCYG